MHNTFFAMQKTILENIEKHMYEKINSINVFKCIIAEIQVKVGFL